MPTEYWIPFSIHSIFGHQEVIVAELKTQKTSEKPSDFIERIEDSARRQDCARLMKIMGDAMNAPPTVWGSSIIGFGEYKYKSGGKLNDWFLTGFASRKANITIYLMSGYNQYGALMKKLGKHKTQGSCLHFKSLDDVDSDVLAELIKRSTTDFKKKYLGSQGSK
jgi:Domain of unknown function (DU1801).